MLSNTNKLLDIFIEKGLPICGVSSDGRIDFLPNITNQQKKQYTSEIQRILEKFGNGEQYNDIIQEESQSKEIQELKEIIYEILMELNKTTNLSGKSKNFLERQTKLKEKSKRLIF